MAVSTLLSRSPVPVPPSVVADSALALESGGAENAIDNYWVALNSLHLDRFQ